MKMNRKFTVLRLLVLASLVAGFNATPLSAQESRDFKGTFTLLYATRWGNTNLPAGEYSLKVDKGIDNGVVTVFRGTQSVAWIRAAGMSQIKSGRSEMFLKGGTVREVHLPLIGLTLKYPAHNAGRRAAPQEPLAAQVIPIVAMGSGR